MTITFKFSGTICPDNILGTMTLHFFLIQLGMLVHRAVMTSLGVSCKKVWFQSSRWRVTVWAEIDATNFVIIIYWRIVYSCTNYITCLSSPVLFLNFLYAFVKPLIKTMSNMDFSQLKNYTAPCQAHPFWQMLTQAVWSLQISLLNNTFLVHL